MKYDEKKFLTVALPRIKKYYERHKNFFLAGAIDYKDLLQEMRVIIWKAIKKINSLTDLELDKLTNDILSKRLISAKRQGHKHMISELLTDEEGNVIDQEDSEREVKGHIPQFVNIDDVEESYLVDHKFNHKHKLMVEEIKSMLTTEEWNILSKICIDKYTEVELACEMLPCDQKGKCLIKNDKTIINRRNNVGKRDFKKGCTNYTTLNNKAVAINRLKKQILEKVKKNLK